MAKAIELQEELKKLGVELTGKETYNELQKKLADKKKELAANNGDSDKDKGTAKGGALFVWLKSRSYVDSDGKKRLAAGFYKVESMAGLERLFNRPSSLVEIFEGELPTRRLNEIARWCGVDPDKYDDNDELIAVIAKEAKPSATGN